MAREVRDYYPTPSWAVDRFLERYTFWPYKVGTVLEPSIGSGNIFLAAKDHDVFSKARWTGVDIHPLIELDPPHKLVKNSFLNFHPIYDFDVCMSNFPYSEAEEHIKHALSMSHLVITLVRNTFIESSKRNNWLRQQRPSLYSLPNRLKNGTGQDNVGRSWLVFDRRGDFEILADTPKEERLGNSCNR